jgi:zinc transporter 1/2/3
VTLIFYKILAALLIFFVSIATIIYPLKKKLAPKHSEPAHLGDALASGIFLGAAIFHMLPDATHFFNDLYPAIHFPLAELVCLSGFLLLLLLERLSLGRSVKYASHTVPYLLAIILVIHALIEGAALGIGKNLTETFLLFIAIMAHKGSESFALCMTLLRHDLAFKRILFIILFFALMTPLGIGLGTLVQELTQADNGELAAAIFNAFAAGTFLYISTLHHIHFHQHTEDSQGIIEFGCLAFGTLMMGVIALWT